MSKPKKWDTMTPEEQEAWRAKIREYYRKWQKDNPEKVREKRRKWRKANPDWVREINHKYREVNLQKLRENDRKYHEAKKSADAFMQMTAAAATISTKPTETNDNNTSKNRA